MASQDQQRILSRLLHIVEPLGGDAIAEQFIIGPAGE
jgi:hypothetical protein